MRLREVGVQVAGIGVNQIALDRHHTVQRQVVQFNGKKLGLVGERAVVIENHDARGVRIACGECAQIWLSGGNGDRSAHPCHHGEHLKDIGGRFRVVLRACAGDGLVHQTGPSQIARLKAAGIVHNEIRPHGDLVVDGFGQERSRPSRALM